MEESSTDVQSTRHSFSKITHFYPTQISQLFLLHICIIKESYQPYSIAKGEVKERGNWLKRKKQRTKQGPKHDSHKSEVSKKRHKKQKFTHRTKHKSLKSKVSKFHEQIMNKIF